MMNKTVISIIAVVLISIGGFLIFSRDDNDTETESPSQPAGDVADLGQTIVIQGHKLSQGDLEIEVGTTVIWENKDNLVGLPYNRHTVTSGVIDRTGAEGVKGVVPNSGSGISDSMYQKGLALNDSFEYTFTEPGIYTFYIAEHPLVSGEGRIVVTESTQSGSAGSDSPIAMEAKSFSFSPDTLQATVGEVISLAIVATGQHTFTIDELDIDVTLLHGETTKVEFTPEKPGTFEFYCAIPGHKEAGQIGTLVVE